jgi:flagellar assembly factor FliW
MLKGAHSVKINSTYLGEQVINPDTIITFPRGLPGFETCTRYKLFNGEAEPTVYLLQSLDDDEVMFSMALPEKFNFAYELLLSDEEARLIEAEDPAQIVVLLLLSRTSDEKIEESTVLTEGGIRANLNGPVLLNLDKRLAMQKVLQKPQHITLIRALEE